jgi:hypothetical protein
LGRWRGNHGELEHERQTGLDSLLLPELFQLGSSDVTRVIAVDWSGKAKGAAESIWRAVVVDGYLIELENGLDRERITQWIIDYARRYPRNVVGLDFACSFPEWFCKREDWNSGRDVWAAMRTSGDDLLARCEPPFWGRPGTKAQTTW